MSVSKSRNGAGSRSSVHSEKAPGRRMRMGLLGTSALMGVALATSIAGGASAQDTVAVVQGSFYTPYVVNRLNGAGQTTVAITNYTAATLSNYSAVITYGNTYNDFTALSDYVFNGGVLVLTPWQGVNTTVPTHLQVFNNGGNPSYSGSFPGLNILDASSPLLNGVTAPGAGGFNFGYLGGIDFADGTEAVARYADGAAFLGSETYGSGRIIALNLHLITSDSSPEVMNQDWVTRLVLNAVNYLGVPATPNINSGQSYTTSQLASSLVNPVFDGGTLTVSGVGTITNNFTVNASGGIISGGGFGSTFSGVFSDGATPGGSLTINGGGTVAFSGTNTFTGGVIVDGATLVLNNTAGAGTGTIHMVDPQINFGATGTYTNDISLEVADGQQAADPTILNNTSGGNITLSGRIYETPGVGGANQYVTFSGVGTTFLTNGANSWGGVTTVNGGTTLSGATGSISGGSIVNNGTVIYTNTSAGAANQNISGSGGVQVIGTGVTLNGNISTSGQLQVNGAGAGLTLGGARTGANNTGVVVSGTGATLTVADAGSIQGGQYNGVRVTGANTTVTNLGTVRNSGTGGDGGVGAGVYVANGGAGGVTTVNNGSTVDTGAGSVIQGRNAGVRHEAGSTDTLVVNNYGHIIGDLYNGIENTAGGLTVNNFSGGYIWTLLGNGISSNSTGAVTVTNAGVIGQNTDGSQIVGGNGVVANGGLTVANQSGGLIIGQTSGVTANAGLTLTNTGTISGVTGTGVVVTGALDLTNNAGGVISGSLDTGSGVGVNVLTAGGTITNAGRIDSGNTGVQTVGGTITNQAGGVIVAAGHGVIANGGLNLTNSGTIQGSGSNGVLLNVGGTITNQTGGMIIGADNGVIANGDLALTNAGTIRSNIYNGVLLNAGGTVTNQTGGVITGGGAGIFSGANLNLTNAGNISGANYGVEVYSGAVLDLTNTGTIRATSNFAAVHVNGSAIITNSGTLAGGSNGTYGAGVWIDTGALDLTNQAGGQITGAMGVRFSTGGTGLITNAGVMSAINSVGAAGTLTINNQAGGTISGAAGSAIDSNNGGRLVIDNAGTITGVNWGIVGRNANDSITNSGTIQGVNQQGVILAAGGVLTNQATGVIRGANDAVQLLNSGTVTNAGQIHGGTGSFQRGVFATGADSTVNNQAGGVIDGWRGIQLSSGASNATVNNAGTIQSFGNYGVITFNTATINNQAGGLITSDIGGVYANGFPLTLTNAGTITGGQYNAVTVTAGGTITNQATGVINAMPVSGWGVLSYANTTVGNDGVINADSGLASAGGVMTVTNTGTINGTVDGLLGVGGVFNVTNSGTISASNTTTGRGMNLGGGVNTITNQATGVISGWRGIELAANAGGSTITNAGSITGGQQGILSLAGGVLVANTGTISASAGHGLYLDLGGTLTNSGTISGRDHAFIGNGTSTVTNQLGGVMTGTIYNAVYTGGAGSVISNAGLMNGGNAGVYTDGANTSLTNTGTIRVTGTTAPTVISGVYMAGAGSSVTNAGTIESTLTDGRGVYLSGGAGTITNQSGGVISGNGAGAAIILTGTDYTVDLQSGSTVNGVIDASLSDGHNVLTVAGAANGGYVGGTGADDVTLMGGMTLTGVLNGMDGVDSLILAGAADGALNTGVLGGFEARTMNGAGSWTLSGVDDDTSTWTLNAGVLRVTGNQSINNAADVVINAGGTLAVIDSEAIGALSGTGSVVVSDLQALLVGADDSSSTFDGVISGLGGLQHIGAGVLTLTGANTYTGATVVSSGTLQLGGSGVIADGSDLSVASGATLDLQGFNETVDLALISGTLAGTGTLTGSEYQLNGATVNANLGAGNLFNTGGVSVLNGTAASANVSVLAGTLTLGAADRLNDAAVLTIASGGTLDLDGHNETVGSAYINGTLEGFGTIAPPPMPALFEKAADDGRQVLPGVGTGTLTAGQYVLNGATINGNLGAGNLFNVGGVSTLSGLVSAGSVTVNAGTLRLEAADRLNDAAVLTVATGATFDLYGHNETVNLAVINGTLDGFGTTLAPIGWGYDKTVSDLVERLPGIGVGTLTASQYQLNGATINGNLGAGTLFNVSGLSILNGTAGANAVSVLAGTLRLGAGNRLSDSATVSVSLGATLDLQSFSDTVNLALLNGVLTGTGTLTAGEYQLNGATVNGNLGAGNLFNTGGVSLLNGTSNAANVVVQSGTLRLGASDRISNTADLSVSTSATFDLNGNMETVRGLFGSGNVAVGAGRLTFGGVDSGFNGVLSGAGSVVHTANLFTLMGNGHTLNTFSNTGGELRFLASTTGNVNVSGGSMTGAGTIGGALTVSGGATLSPGLAGTNNGIGGFNVGSLVMNGGRLSLDVLGVSGGNLTDVIQVTGNANLTGGTLAPNFHGPVTDFDFSTRYLFLTAGSRTGTFANGNAFTADPGGLAGLYWRLRYDLVANGVVMELRQLTNFTGSDGTANQNQVAGALSEGQLEASDDWANVLSAFAGLDRDDQLAAFDSAGGEAIADISTSLFGANDSFMSAVRNASSSQANGSASMNFASTLGFVGGREGESAMVANVLGAFDPGAEVAAANGGWISAYAGDASLEGKPGQAEVKTQMNGFAGGWATTQGDITVGVAGGVTRVEGDVDQRASTYESDLTHGAAFMRFDNGTWSVGVTGSLYGGQIDSRRTITVGALTGVATGSTDGEGQSISASVSRRFQLDGDTMLAFGAETTASRINLDGFTEAGAGGLSLEVTAQSREWLTTVLSGRINRTYRLNGRDFGLYGGLGVMLTSGDRQALAVMRFSGAAIGFGDFTVEGAETAPVAGVADIGFEADMSDSTTVSLGYRGVFNERLDDHQVGARIQIRW